MAKKAPGRPKVKAAPKDLKDQKDAKTDQSTDKAEETNEQDLADQKEVSDFPDISSESDDKDAEINELKAKLKKVETIDKVVDVKINTNKKTRLKPSEQNKITHTVIVKGQPREISRQAYEAVSKDPALNVTLPKGSRLAEPMLDKPCEDC